MKHKIIFTLVSIWLLGSFAIEVSVFLSSLGRTHIVVPLASSIGVFAWFGMILRKSWGIGLLYVYVFLNAFYVTEDLMYSNHRLYSLCALIILIALALPFTKYVRTHGGILWATGKTEVKKLSEV